MKKTWDVNNWVLKLFFQHLDNPIKKRLELADSADTSIQHDQDIESSGTPHIGEGSSNTPGAQATLPSGLQPYPQPDPIGLDWFSASQFFSSKEAENFSLYQLEPHLFGNESYDFTFDPTIDISLPGINEPFPGPV